MKGGAGPTGGVSKERKGGGGGGGGGAYWKTWSKAELYDF